MSRPIAAATLAVLAALSACGGDGSGGGEGREAPTAEPVGAEVGGSVVQGADCRDWRTGTVAQRRATVVELRRQLTPQGDPTPESALSDERAYEILEEACKPSWAGSLRLYKLYVRAQGFAPLSE